MIKACDELGVFVVQFSVPEFDEFREKDDYKQVMKKTYKFLGKSSINYFVF